MHMPQQGCCRLPGKMLFTVRGAVVSSRCVHVPQEQSAQLESQRLFVEGPALVDVRLIAACQTSQDVDVGPPGRSPTCWELPEPRQLRSDPAVARPDQDRCHPPRARKRLSLVLEQQDEEAACRVQELQEELDSVRERLAEAVAGNRALTEAADAARVAAAQEQAESVTAGTEAPQPQGQRLASPRRWGSARGRQLAAQLEDAERALKARVCAHTAACMDPAGMATAMSARSFACRRLTCRSGPRRGGLWRRLCAGTPLVNRGWR